MHKNRAKILRQLTPSIVTFVKSMHFVKSFCKLEPNIWKYAFDRSRFTHVHKCINKFSSEIFAKFDKSWKFTKSTDFTMFLKPTGITSFIRIRLIHALFSVYLVYSFLPNIFYNVPETTPNLMMLLLVVVTFVAFGHPVILRTFKR